MRQSAATRPPGRENPAPSHVRRVCRLFPWDAGGEGGPAAAALEFSPRFRMKRRQRRRGGHAGTCPLGSRRACLRAGAAFPLAGAEAERRWHRLAVPDPPVLAPIAWPGSVWGSRSHGGFSPSPPLRARGRTEPPHAGAFHLLSALQTLTN